MGSRKVWWVAPRISQESFERMAPLSPLAAQLLHNRGITDPSEARAFLNPQEGLFHDPLLLPDMEQAISRINRAIHDGETIGIFGDFDADGITGTALLAEGLMALGATVVPYLPHRVTEGHGLNDQAVRFLHDQGATLLVTVDCGVTSPAEVREAASFGMDTIITDHHAPIGQLPAALAVVNPNLPGSGYPSPHLAGVGLALKLVQGLYGHLGRPWDQRLLQLAAVGTIADVAPLVGENRHIVAAGLRSLGSDPRPGFKELLRLGGLDGNVVDTEAVAFVLGPRLNAPGRLAHAIGSYNLLRARSQEEAMPLAQDVDRLNRERQELTRRAVEIAREEMGPDRPPEQLILLGSEEFVPGIVGLLAGRLVEEHYRPAVIVALDGQEARGSARSIPEFDIAAAFTECQDLFTHFGGHPRAAGFVMPRANIPALSDRLQAIARRELAHQSLEPTLAIDAHVRLTTLTGENFQFLLNLAPYGEGNPNPIFLTRGVEVAEVLTMGNQGQHLRLKLRHGGALWDGVAFNQSESWPPDAALLDLVYSVGVNRWRGNETVQMVIEDLRPAEGG